MKKAILITMSILGVVFTTSAQEKGKIEFAVGSGLNYSNAGNRHGNSDTNISFNVAVGADYYFSDRWSVRAKVIYDRKGWDNGFYGYYEPLIDNIFYARTDYNLNYLTVPVEASWHFGRKRNWYLHLGPYAGFLLNAEATDIDQDVTDGFETTDFGVALGIGVKIPVSDKLKIFIEYDEQTGFSEIFKNNEGSRITNSRGSFNVGLNFLLY